MLTGPRINADDVTSPCGLFLTCREKNMYGIIPVPYINSKQNHVWSLSMQKIPLLGWWPMAIPASCRPNFALDSWKLTARFPTSHWPRPFPRPTPPFQPHTSHMWHSFTKGRRHQHIGCLLYPYMSYHYYRKEIIFKNCSNLLPFCLNSISTIKWTNIWFIVVNKDFTKIILYIKWLSSILINRIGSEWMTQIS